MAVDSELAAIIGGCVAGAVGLIGIVAVIICLCCGKRRKKKDRDQKKFQQLTPHTSPTHSQPSSLGHMPPGQDPRLPKVGSNGLWMGTPGIYAGTPSPAYYYGRPGGKPPSYAMQPAVMQRASSETGIPQRDRQVPQGPAVYNASGSQQRIYHSQQLASLTPLYEVMDPRDGAIYDVYQIGGGSKTRLLQENGSKSIDRQSKNSKKVQRSHSDAAPDPARRPHRHKPSQEGHRASKTGSVTRETAEVHAPKETTPEEKEKGVDNVGFIGSSENITKEEKAAAVASATDSMKLLAKNKTDDQKKVVHPSGSDSDNKQSPPTPVPAPAPDPSLHYTYGGDIYAVPDKEESRRRSRSENPILACMQDMVIARAEGLEPGQTTDPVTDLTETTEPLVIMPNEGVSGHGASLIQNPIYQEVEEPAVRTTDSTSEVVAAIRSAADEIDGGVNSVGDSGRTSGDVAAEDVAASSALTSVRDVGASGVGEEQQDVVKGALETRWSMDTDAATDELSRAGKHISVTAQAFEFLDTYLSDEDGGDMQSPPKSPVLSDRAEMMY